MIEIYEMEMKSLNNRKRKIRVFLPDTYNKGNVIFPVIYMHDGQNLFNDDDATYGKSWNIKNNFNMKKYEFIVVGIDSGDGLTRLDELAPKINSSAQKISSFITRPCGGELDLYLKFIIDELKPFIDSKYRTDKNNTWIAGSSMGGLASLYGMLKYPSIFKKAVCLSSAFWFDEAILLELINSYQFSEKRFVYLGFGAQEADEKENEYLIDFHKVIEYKLNKIKIVCHLDIDKIGKHNEASWEYQFIDAVNFLIK